MFKVGDKVKVISNTRYDFGKNGVIVSVLESGDYHVLIDNYGKVLCADYELERTDDMTLSERLAEVIKENQNLKQQLSEQNIKLNNIQADVNRELRDKQGVSDEGFREALDFYENADQAICYEVWGAITLSLIFQYNSLSEFVSRYKEYEQKKEEENKGIKVGDEVYYLDKHFHYVVTYIDEQNIAIILSQYGKYGTVNVVNLHKTGKHYDIESMLNQLKE